VRRDVSVDPLDLDRIRLAHESHRARMHASVHAQIIDWKMEARGS
jgi:hypothetical protein